MNCDIRPIFVIGTRFSGTGLLALGLGQHTRLSVLVDDELIRSQLAFLGGAYRTMESGGRVTPAAVAGVQRSQFLISFADSLDRLVWSVIGSPSRNGSDALADWKRSFPNAEQQPSCERWVNAGQGIVPLIQGLIEVFPQSKFIHVLRNAEDVIAMEADKLASDGSLFSEESAYEDWAYTTALCLSAEETLGSDAVFRVDHDDLVRSPVDTIRASLTFVGESFESRCVRPLRGLELPAADPDRPPGSNGSTPDASRLVRLSLDLNFEVPMVNGDDEADESASMLESAFADFIRKHPGQYYSGSQSMTTRVRQVVRRTVPRNATVLVVTRGDDRLLKLDGRSGWHFPRSEDGGYAGFYPADGAEAIAHLAELYSQGAEYIVFPSAAFWWLDYYQELRQQLYLQHELIWKDDAVAIFALSQDPAVDRAGRSRRSEDDGKSNETFEETARNRTTPRNAIATEESSTTIDAGRAPGPPDFDHRPSSAQGIVRDERFDPFEFMALTGSSHVLPRIYLQQFNKKPDRVVKLMTFLADQGTNANLHEALALWELVSRPNVREKADLLAAEILSRLGDLEEARAELSESIHTGDACPDHWLRLMALAGDEPVSVERDNLRLSFLSRALNLVLPDALGLEEEYRGLRIDNIAVRPEPTGSAMDVEMVSVLLPTGSNLDDFKLTLRSVRDQTWANIELIVVVTSEFDISLLHQMLCNDTNVRVVLGNDMSLLSAFNLASKFASGEYLAPACPGDWWSPLRLSTLIKRMNRPQKGAALAIGKTASVGDRLEVYRNEGAPGPADHNPLCAIFRPEVFESLSGWHDSPIGAPEDFIARAKRMKFRIEECPGLLGLDLFRPDHSATMVENVIGPTDWARHARYEFEDGASAWASKTCVQGLATCVPSNDSPAVDAPSFAIPDLPTIITGKRKYFDVILATNFTMAGGSVLSSIEEIQAQHDHGLTTGIVQLYSSRTGHAVRKYMHSRVRSLVDSGAAERIMPGEEVSCDVLLVRYPPVLDHINSILPGVNASEVRVIINQPPQRTEDAEAFYDLRECRDNLAGMTGNPGIWHPIGPAARKAVADHENEVNLANWDWVNIIDIESWPVKPPVPPGDIPVIGRHTRDDTSKWPEDPFDIMAAYSVNSPGIQVRILGGAKTAKKIMKTDPANWEVYEFDSIPVQEFLASIDFFVFFPHPQRIEAFGRSILEALAMGIPAILPPMFEPTFGDAAIYCQPSEVEEIVRTIFSDQDQYVRLSQYSRRVVEDRFSREEHIRRLNHVGCGVS